MTVPSARPELAPSSARSAGQGWRSRRRRRLGLDRASTQLSWSRPAICRFPGTWTSIRAMRWRRINLHPVGHISAIYGPHPYPSAREAEVQEERDPSTWRLFALSTAGHALVPEIGDRLRSSPENGSSRDHAGLEVPPERDDQFSRDGDDRDLAYSALQCTDPLAKPSRQLTFGLMPQP